MRTIKTYESFKAKDKSILDEIKEAFLELSDIGYIIDVKKENQEISVEIQKDELNRIASSELKDCLFNINDIKETLDFAVPYIKDALNLDIDKIEVMQVSFLSAHRVTLDDFNKIDNDKQIAILTIFFKKTI
jgi:hypothetical protein